MSTNRRQGRIPAGQLDAPAYIVASDTAQHLLLVLWLLADDEGRASASPLVIKANGRLHASVENIAAALHELAEAGLVALYGADGKSHLFLPDWFSEPGGIAYWSKSALPLPSQEDLAAHPAYLAALRRLSVRGRMDFSGEARDGKRDGPRYPALWPEYAERSRSGKRAVTV